jgi:hypothetical protein
MECATRNYLVLSYLRSQVERAEAEIAVKTQADADRQKALDEARSHMAASRRELLDHCHQHGC